MRGDVICHAVEIEGYWRTSPGGRRVFVKSYRRVGNAASDDRTRRINQARAHYQGRIDAAESNYSQWVRDPNAFTKMVKVPVYSEWRSTGNPGEKTRTKLYDETKPVPITQREAHAPVSKAMREQQEAIRREENYIPTISDIVKYAATDAYEIAKTNVGNFIEDAKVVAGDAVKIASDKISSGANAVKSFFSRLFGRR